MAQYAEVTVLDGAKVVTVFNNAVTAISAGYAVLYETVSGYPRAVKLPTGSGGTARLAGVTLTSIPAGGYGLIVVHGPAQMYGHEAIATGQFVQVSDTTSHLGEGIVAVLTASGQNLGECLQACGADGDLFEVFVNITQVSKAAT